MVETRTSICRICECMCGIEVDVEANRISAIRPDREHVATQGYACVKGTAFAGTQHSPDRILEPMKREGKTWRAISWQQALGEIGRSCASCAPDMAANRSRTGSARRRA
jgi:anaerobic selenocysteine-containing dehydrogenase